MTKIVRYEIPKLLKQIFENPKKKFSKDDMLETVSVLIKKMLLNYDRLNLPDKKHLKEMCEFQSKIAGWMDNTNTNIPQVTLNLAFIEPVKEIETTSEKIAEKLVTTTKLLK